MQGRVKDAEAEEASETAHSEIAAKTDLPEDTGDRESKPEDSDEDDDLDFDIGLPGKCTPVTPHSGFFPFSHGYPFPCNLRADIHLRQKKCGLSLRSVYVLPLCHLYRFCCFRTS